MVRTTEITPCPALQSFIRCYTLREFNTGDEDFIKPLPAYHEVTISFILAGNFFSSKNSSSDHVAGHRSHLVGLQTETKGAIIFNGDIKFFTILFKPNGFYRLYGIPLNTITDNIYNLADISLKGVDEYNDRLNEAKNLQELKNLSDKFFVSHLNKSKSKDPYSSITSTSSLIFDTNGNVNIKSLASDANMSLRSFEMNFTQQVGIPPKLFSRITRFNYALMIKMKNMSKSWTDICHHCGYYDQMHFIKEFKQFTGNTPLNFYKNTPLPIEDYRKG
ncbi:MAG: AraC family transcriptional regulator [Segetibacter sp.]|jgi:AraC-like DNA-binding protein|nr:AraC family transcriptional regulator [Segetibacter sp.]